MYATETDNSKDNLIKDLLQQQQEYIKSIQNLQQQLENKDKEQEALNNATPNLKLISTPTFTVIGGRKVTLSLEIKNISSVTARNVLIQASLGDASAMPFTLKFLKETNVVSSINAGSTKLVELELDVSPSVDSKTYSINLDYSFSNDAKKAFTGKDTIYVKVDNSASVGSTFPRVSMLNFKVDNNNITEDSTVTLSSTLQNLGQQGAYDIQVVVDGLSTETLTITNGTNSLYFNSLDANSKDNINFTIQTSKKIKSGSYPLTFKITYKDNTGKDYTNEQKYFINVVNTKEQINQTSFVQIKDLIAPENTFKVGEAFSLNLDVINTGDGEAKNIKITAEYGTDGAIIPKSPAVQFLNTLTSGEEKRFTFTFTATKTAKSQNYPISFKLEYEDTSLEEDKLITHTQYTGVNIHNPELDDKTNQASFVQIRNLTVPENTFGVGQTFSLNLDVINTGIANAKNVKIIAEYGADGAIVPKSTTTQFINLLSPNEEKKFTFTFAATKNAKSQNYPISFKIEYEEGSENKVTTYTQYTGVNINNPDEEDEKDKPKSIPKIIISKYSCDPIMVKAGEEFDLHMSFTNTHPTKTVSNIKIFFTVSAESKTGNVFIPVDSSNTFYVNKISPQGTVDTKVRLFAMPDAEPKTYNLIVNFDYEDETGALPAATENIGISVKQPTKLETSDIFIPSQGNVGEPIFINFNFYNTGKVTMSNLRIKMTGDFDTQDSDSYFGNLESGQSEYYEGIIIPNTPGKQYGKLIISYDEPNGERVERVTDIDLAINERMIMEAFNPDGMGMDSNGKFAEPEKKGINFKSPILWVSVAVIVIIIAGVVVFIIRKKKKKGFDLDE